MIIKNLKKQYDEVLFESIDYQFETGKIYSIFGRNGIGKTTLLKILSNQIPFDEGEIIVNNDDIMFVADSTMPFDYLTGFEFICYTLRLKNIKIDKEDIIVKFKEFQLYEEKDKFICNYSKGMKYKLIIILILIINPSILLMDEPFVDLDIITIKKIKQIFKTYKTNKIIIFSTHILDIAHSLSDKILFLNRDGIQEIDNLGVSKISNFIFNNMKGDV